MLCEELFYTAKTCVELLADSVLEITVLHILPLSDLVKQWPEQLDQKKLQQQDHKFILFPLLKICNLNVHTSK